MATVADDFNRPDEEPLGAPWAVMDGMQGLEVVSQQAVGIGSTNNGMLWSDSDGSSFEDDQFAETTLTGGGDDGGPAVRVSPTEQTLYTTFISGGDRWIAKFVAGTSSTLGAAVATGGDLGAGDVLRLEVSGTDITLLVNGNPLGTRTDTDITSGRPGLYSWSSSVTWDDWSGGDLATTAASSGTSLVAATSRATPQRVAPATGAASAVAAGSAQPAKGAAGAATAPVAAASTAVATTVHRGRGTCRLGARTTTQVVTVRPTTGRSRLAVTSRHAPVVSVTPGTLVAGGTAPTLTPAGDSPTLTPGGQP